MSKALLSKVENDMFGRQPHFVWLLKDNFLNEVLVALHAIFALKAHFKPLLLKCIFVYSDKRTSFKNN